MELKLSSNPDRFVKSRHVIMTGCLLAILLAGCGPQDPASEQIPGSAKGSPMQASSQPAIQYHETIDRNNGMVQAISPFPADWQVRQMPDGTLAATGPNGIRLHPTEISRFAWSQDPFTQQTIVQMGQRLSPVLPLEQILEEQIRPAAAAQGNRLVRSYPTPEIEGFWVRFGTGMAQTGSQRRWQAVGSDWTDGRGTKTFVSIVQTIFRKQQILYWILQTTSLEAPEEAFEEAKRAYVYAVGNTQINPQWQQMKNGQLTGQIRANESFARDMMARSRAAHQQRMAAIRSSGNTARSVGETYSDILDISHDGYLKRDDMTSAGQAHLVDAIGERSIIANHETGEHYQVDAGAKYYWVGNDATYFGTDNPLYDPRTDQRVNDVEWTKFVVER